MYYYKGLKELAGMVEIVASSLEDAAEFLKGFDGSLDPGPDGLHREELLATLNALRSVSGVVTEAEARLSRVKKELKEAIAQLIDIDGSSSRRSTALAVDEAVADGAEIIGDLLFEDAHRVADWLFSRYRDKVGNVNIQQEQDTAEGLLFVEWENIEQ